MNYKKSITIGNILKWLGVIVGIFIFVLFVEDRIEKMISDKLKDPAVIKQVASLVRPSLIFNQHGNITHDIGAKQFIKDISVEMGNHGDHKIIIYPKEHLNIPPILECINENFYTSTKRINESDWIYDLLAQNIVIMGGEPKKKELLFRLEIIR